LLIYLSEQKKQELLRNLENILSPDGILILGHAELSQAVLAQFAPVGVPGSFAVHRRLPEDVQGGHLQMRASTVGLLTTPTPQPKPTGRLSHHPDMWDKRVAKIKSEEIERLVTKIEKLADGGQLDEAAQSCVPVVDASVDDPDLYYVCGLVYEAVGRQAQAIKLLRRAVELQPEHYRSLILLAATLESQGEIEEALKLRRAAEEIAERN
jgi:chemotaxis protein methyltransferase WspC